MSNVVWSCGSYESLVTFNRYGANGVRARWQMRSRVLILAGFGVDVDYTTSHASEAPYLRLQQHCECAPLFYRSPSSRVVDIDWLKYGNAPLPWRLLLSGRSRAGTPRATGGRLGCGY